VETRFYNFVLQSMFKGGFSQVGFASFLGCMDIAVCKGWLSLVARPYIFDLLLIKSGLRGGVRIINP
jgi:hypothetical protein